MKRKAQIVEEGRRRTLERKELQQQHAEQKARMLQEKRELANATRQSFQSQKWKKDLIAEKRAIADEGRQESMDNLRAKHLKNQQTKLNNAERALQVQREHLQARMNQQAKREERLYSARKMHTDRREQARFEVNDLAREVVALEHEESLCVQRLQHSRVVSQTVLSELEQSLGAGSSIAGQFRYRVHAQPDVLRHGPPEHEGAPDHRPATKGKPAVGKVESRPGIDNASNTLSALKFESEDFEGEIRRKSSKANNSNVEERNEFQK